MAGRRNRSGELPFDGDPAVRFLPGVVALMVFLTILALAFALLLDRAVEDWRASLTARLTVQVPDGPAADQTAATALELVRATPGIASARVLEKAEIIALLEPWLGPAAGGLDLPLPRLIDATLAPERELDVAALTARLREVAPDIALDDHRDWLADIVRLAQALEWLAASVIILVGASSVAAIAFVVRSGLAIHRDIIDLLHLIGAQDRYVARQFQRHAARQGWRGAALGLLGALLAALPIVFLARQLEGPIFAGPGLLPWHWGALALVPVASVLCAGVTARVTVARALARLP